MHYFNKEALTWEERQNESKTLIEYTDKQYEEFINPVMLYNVVVDEETGLPKLSEKDAGEKYFVLNEWFNTLGRHYMLFEQQLRRREYLGKTDLVYDIIFKKTYSSLSELYAQAEWVALQLQVLKTELRIGIIQAI